LHSEAWGWLTRHATTDPVSVLDLGGRVVNWDSPRVLFPNATSYTVLDILPGPGVDIVADAATWNPNGRRYDVAVAAELFEHAPEWPAICRTAFAALAPGGQFIVTTAAPGRPPHSGVDGMALRFGEFYANVPPAALQAALEDAGFVDIEVDVQPSPSDVRAVATRPT
jgi:methyltransferase family protein